MLPRKHPDGIHIAFDDHRLVNNAGLILPATLALHLGLPQLVDRHLDLGPGPRPSQHRGQDDDPGCVCLGGWRLHRRRRCAAHRGDGLHPGRHAQGAIHPGNFPAQLPVGPRPPAGPGEPRAAGPGLGRWGRTRRRAIHHRPRFHHLRDLRSGQGGRPPPRLYRQAGLSPAVGRGRRHRGRADVPAARGPAQTPPAAPPTSCGRRWDGYATPGPKGNSQCGPTAGSMPTPSSPSVAKWMSASPSPSASTKACAISSRRYPKMPGRRFPTGWTAAPMWPRPPTLPPRVILTPRRCGSSSGGVKPTPGSQMALFATYSYHGFVTDRDGEMLELEADHRRHAEIENAIPRPQARRRAEPSPLGPLRCQRRLAGGTGDGPTTSPAGRPASVWVSRW